ncbi:MAG: desulfoferrodoxin [Spirochaetota bacterium]
MTKRDQIYKCEICGNIIEVVHACEGQLVCCGKPMTLVAENTTDAAKEKHVPVVNKNGKDITVKVGSVAHPMEEKHFIEWIEVIQSNGKVCRKFLKPGEAPEASFCGIEDIVTVREFCNIHGLWKA